MAESEKWPGPRGLERSMSLSQFEVFQQTQAKMKAEREAHDRAQWLAGYEAAKAQAAAVARATFPRGSAHTYASENADIYLAQEAACERAATRILAMEPRDE